MRSLALLSIGLLFGAGKASAEVLDPAALQEQQEHEANRHEGEPQEFDDDEERAAAFAEALQIVTELDPVYAAELMAVIQDREEGVVDEILEHADYLQHMARMEEADPEQYELLKHQEELEGELQERVEVLHEDPENEELHHETEELMEEWFELRQRMRGLELNRVAAECDELREHVLEAEANSDEFRAAWQERLLEGDLEEGEFLDAGVEPWLMARAPSLVDLMWEHDEEMAEELEHLFEAEPEVFVEVVRGLLEEEPEIASMLEESSERIDALQQHFEVLAEARSYLGVMDASSDDLEQELNDPRFQAALISLAQTDLALVRLDLEEIEGEMHRMEEFIQEREQRREIIIELQWARMFGFGDLFEW